MSAAIVLWLGYGVKNYPQKSVEPVIQRWGGEIGTLLLGRVLELHREFSDTDAHLRLRDIWEAGDDAAARFRSLHPEVTEEAVSALEWDYTFSWK